MKVLHDNEVLGSFQKDFLRGNVSYGSEIQVYYVN